MNRTHTKPLQRLLLTWWSVIWHEGCGQSMCRHKGWAEYCRLVALTKFVLLVWSHQTSWSTLNHISIGYTIQCCAYFRVDNQPAIHCIQVLYFRLMLYKNNMCTSVRGFGIQKKIPTRGAEIDTLGAPSMHAAIICSRWTGWEEIKYVSGGAGCVWRFSHGLEWRRVDNLEAGMRVLVLSIEASVQASNQHWNANLFAANEVSGRFS